MKTTPCPICQTQCVTSTLLRHYLFLRCPQCNLTYVCFPVSQDHEEKLREIFSDTAKKIKS